MSSLIEYYMDQNQASYPAVTIGDSPTPPRLQAPNPPSPPHAYSTKQS